MKRSILYDKIKLTAEQNPDIAVFRYKENNTWKSLTYKQYILQSEKLAKHLFVKGIKKGDVVASYTNNSVWLNILDLALLQIGAVHTIFFPNYSQENLNEAIQYIQPKAIFGHSGLFLSNLMKVKNDSHHSFQLYSLSTNRKNILSISDLISDDEVSDVIFETISPDDPYSIYFTSGTTGSAKGALVSNRAIVNTIDTLQGIFTLEKNDSAISIAPLSVSSERCLNYFYQCSGVTTYYSESMETIIETIQVAKPSVFLTSPLMLHKIRDTIYAKLNELPSGFKKSLLKKALAYAEVENNINRKSLLKTIFDKLVYSKFRNILGGKVRYIVSGGAASSKTTLIFYHNIGIPVYEGYGMTECHTITVNQPKSKNNTYDHVGTVFGETEIKISDEGEILCRSPYMFYAYFNLPETTQLSFTKDGFFKTGDKGKLDMNGNLKINGRIKNIFKTKAGIYINPEGIEAILMQDVIFNQIVVIGENRSFLTALIYPNNSSNNATIEETKSLIKSCIERFNSTKVGAEQIHDFHILNEPFTIEKDELTMSLKPKRKVIEQHYMNEIQKMYEDK